VSVTVTRDGDSVVVRVSMTLKKCGGRKTIITPEDLADSQPLTAEPQAPLIIAISRALWWQGLIESGKYASITALAAALDIDRCYARRIIGLACLAPDLVQAIVAGAEPSGLSLETLAKGISSHWEKQREWFQLIRN
jgi:hypothetical protein